MKGEQCKFLKFMEGPDKRFVIPVYQRNYDWKTENCKQLYDDLIKIIKGARKSHFFGSIVSMYNPDGANEEFHVIDGQQRLTTVSLLLLAMHNLIERHLLIPCDKNLQRRIYEEYLVDKYEPEETRIKLKPVKNDKRAFSKLFSDRAEHILDSNLTVNYDYFYERIQKSEITVDELFKAIQKLDIINIRLDSEDDPQLIFESLNSTGLDLSEGDKIRNFILMGLPVQLQNDYYEKFWNKIEVHTRYDVSSFIRDYLSVKQQAIPSQRKVYVEFKRFVETRNIDPETLLADLLAYAKRYSILLGSRTGSKALDACIYRLNRLETTVTRPFFLEVLRLYDERKLTSDEASEVFLLAEVYIFRRVVCDLPTNALNKIFLMLHHEIMRYDGTEENYVEKCKYALLSKREKARFPDDDEFTVAFTSRNIYHMNSKNKIYILERIENHGTIEDKDVYQRCNDGIYSVEHVMPQHLTPTWQFELGPDYEQIHDAWLHRIANLTLTAYNSSYSNRSFEEKKNTQNGFADSGIRMNMWIAKKSIWTLAELEERSQYLAQRALTIWATPETQYRPAQKELDSYTLDEDSELMVGRKIAKFWYKNNEYPVSNWREMFQKILQMLMEEDKSIIMHLSASNEETFASYFSFVAEDPAKCAEIGKGVYVYINTDTQTKLAILNMLFKRYGLDASDLVFFMYETKTTSSEDDAPRHDRRRKYWSFALDMIHEAHGDCSFKNVHTTKSNYINGFIGVSGVCISCVANRDAARVELYFGKDDAAENKRLFDSLYARKNEIEAKLGTNLSWNRNDDVMSSKIEYILENVSIENETDWLQMARFHAEWSKKFYDVLVPYVTGQFTNLWQR